MSDPDVIPSSFTGGARRKLAKLLERGFTTCGVMIARQSEDGAVQRGAVSEGGQVIWWPAEGEFAAETPWPKAREVGRLEEMSTSGHLRVGLDSDNDVYISVWKDKGGASVEFCSPGSGGGRSPRTREALIALMVAIEEDNAEDPSRDWWRLRLGTSPKA